MMYPARSLQSGKAHLLLLFLAFLSFTTLTLASTPTSFCKCTCFSNSTIIPLDPAKSGTSSSAIDNALNTYKRAFESVGLDVEEDHEISPRAQKYRSLSCNDCNRKFCLNYELPTCKGAKEEDVFTTCFRTNDWTIERDSRKDEAVVFIFIFATGGLLAWALAKPWIERYLEERQRLTVNIQAARERRSYMPVAEPDS